MNSTSLPARNLDVLRAFAVLSVVGDHVAQLYTERLGPLTVWELGRLGVLLFFVHTALVLMSSLERAGGRRRQWIATFYTRRAFRIYPLAIASIIVYQTYGIPASVRSLTSPTAFAELSARDWAANLTLTQNLVGAELPINVLWSLPLEVQMYLALPLCFLAAKRGWTTVVGLGVMGALGWAATRGLPGVWRLSLLDYVPCFLAGVLAFAVLRRRLPLLPSWCWPLALVGVVGLTALLHPNDYNAPMNWLVCLFVGISIACIRDLPDHWITRGANVICEYSYGVYLTHVAALWVAFVLFRTAPLAAQFTLFAVLTAGFAFAAYHVIELPGIRLGKRLAEMTVVRKAPIIVAAAD